MLLSVFIFNLTLDSCLLTALILSDEILICLQMHRIVRETHRMLSSSQIDEKPTLSTDAESIGHVSLTRIIR